MMKIGRAGTLITELRAAGIISVSEVYQIARTTALKHCVDWKLSTLMSHNTFLPQKSVTGRFPKGPYGKKH